MIYYSLSIFLNMKLQQKIMRNTFLKAKYAETSILMDFLKG